MPTSAPPEIALREPPALPRQEGASGAWLGAIPMLGSLGAVAMVSTAGGGSARQLVAAGGFLLATLGFVVVQLDRARRRHALDLARSRRGYLRHLDAVRTALRAAADDQRRRALAAHPPPGGVPGPGPPPAAEQAGLPVRVGRARQRLAAHLVTGGARDDTEEVDPVCEAARDRLVAGQGHLDDLPVTLDLTSHTRVAVTGTTADDLVRSLLVAAAGTHPPERLRIAVLTDGGQLGSWDWVKWLPHVASPAAYDVLGPRRMVATAEDELTRLLGDRQADAESAHLVLVDDRREPTAPPDPGPGTTLLRSADGHSDSDAGQGGHLLLEATDEGCLATNRPDVVPADTVADACSPTVAEAAARRVAAASPTRAGGEDPTEDAARLLGLADGRGRRPPREPGDEADRLRVPIGLDADGEPLHLDLEESARGGDGPHGLLVGATGSGKSELLRTLVLGLALGHCADRLNLVLVDFKGGATFADLARLPHTAALITNLAGERSLVERMEDALGGELLRRQEVLRASGHDSAHAYEAARRAGATLAPLPSLLVVVDEFSELLSLHPDMAELFVAIGRLGRSLGIHLLLASQRLDEGRLRGLESHLSYRIALRTFSASESRTVIGAPDAHHLPPLPGAGYLRAGPDGLRRFRAACVSSPMPTRRDGPVDDRVLPHVLTELTDTVAAAHRAPPPPPSTTVLEAGVAALAATADPSDPAPAAHPIWLPPLSEPPALGELLREVSPHVSEGSLLVPVGLLDRPREQRRDPLLVDLAHAGGQVAVVGAPRSGKSTVLTTIGAGIALTHSPAAAQLFVLDLGGGCAPLGDLPHTCGIATRAEPDLARRLVAEVRQVMDRRERYFREQQIASVDALRGRDGAPGHSEGYGDGYGEVHLLVDGWGLLRAEQEDLEDEIIALVSRAPALGVHLVLATGRWSDLRPALRDLVGTRLELRLGDPFESEVDRRTASSVPPGRPGRGIVAERLHFLSALPRLSRGGSVEDLVARAGSNWPGRAPVRLRPLPARVGPEHLGPARDGADRPVIGVAEGDLSPVVLDQRADPHLLVTGPAGAGRTTTLRTLLGELVRGRSAGQAQVVLVDPRRGLSGVVPGAHLLHHLVGSGAAGEVLGELASWLEGRLPDEPALGAPDAGPGWTGAAVHVVVDDHDLLGTGGPSPLQPLLPLLPRAHEVGLHVTLARRADETGPPAYDAVSNALAGLATPTLDLTGSPPGRGRLLTRDGGSRLVQVAAPE